VVTSRSSLEPLVHKYELYKRERDRGEPMETVIDFMRRDIHVEANTSRNDVTDGFDIKYRYRDPKVTQAVTAELAAKYVDVQTANTVNSSAAAKQLVSEVERPLAREAAELRSQMIHVCVSAQWTLAHGDTRLVDVALTKLRTPEPGAVGAIVAFYDTCAATIAAWRSVVEHRPGSRALLNRLDSLLLTGTPWHWALPEYRITARLWEAVGEPTHAVAAIRRRQSFAGIPSPTDRPPLLLKRGGLPR